MYLKVLPHLLLSLATLLIISCQKETQKQITNSPIWHPFILEFEGPESSENADPNPFTDVSLVVTFSKGARQINVPGFYAADGKAAETGADSGNIWRVIFTPDELGEWQYQISFLQGADVAFNQNGQSLKMHGTSGRFNVVENNSNSVFYNKGRLKPVGGHLRHANGDYFLKGGAGSPENLLAYKDFDGTYSMDSSKLFIKEYKPHLKDWKAGDPQWQNGKGKGLIGAMNYLASKGMNAVYFITMNIGGDGRDVWPYVDPETFDRFDCSKLDQWNIVFEHAQRLGIMLHFVTQETENELLLDNGDSGPQRKLYYREMLARFGHHPGTTWNLGEENGPASFTPDGQSDQQRRDMVKAFNDLDAYDNYLVLHTHSWEAQKDTILKPILGLKGLDGLSVQIDKREKVYDEFRRWISYSKESGHRWILSMDEIGMWHTGVLSDDASPHHDTIRQEVLWPSLMAGGAGVEWYFGWFTPQNDLNTQDWRTRDILWDQTRYALDFFQKEIPFWEMEANDEFVLSKNGYCLAKGDELYLVYLKKASELKINLGKKERPFEFTYFNPYTGKYIEGQKEVTTKGVVAWPLPKVEKDLVILIKDKSI